MYKKIFLIIVLFTAIIIIGCKNEEGGGDQQEQNEGGTAFRKGDLFSEDIDLGEKAVVIANAPGNNETVERSFENAPPMIPHKTDGFFPITQKNNICLTCHMPDLAEAVGSTPLPVSHFTKYRPEIKKSGGKLILYDESNSTVAVDLDGKLSSAMFNCDQCHVIQTNATLDVKNNFQADFRNESNKTSSNLNETRTEGVK